MAVYKSPGIYTNIAMLVASTLYEKGKLSLGQAAELAGLTKRTFTELLGKYGGDYWFPSKKVNLNTITRCSKISNIFEIEYEPKKTFKIPVGNLSPSKAKKEISNLIRQYSIPIGKI